MYTLPVELYGSPHVVRVIIDINRRRHMERQTGILGRFEQVGTIAASIAQELQRIIERIEQRLMETFGAEFSATDPGLPGTPAGGPVPAESLPKESGGLSLSALQDALAGFRESGEMLNQLLSASCFSDTPRGLLAVNAALRAMLNVCIGSIAPALDTDLRLAADLPPLECAPSSVNSALFCLLTNVVRHCASSRNGAAPSGRIVVETALRDHAIQITMDSAPNAPPAAQAQTPEDGPKAHWPEGAHERLRLACDILHREHGASVFVKAGNDRELGYLVILPLDPKTEAPCT